MEKLTIVLLASGNLGLKAAEQLFRESNLTAIFTDGASKAIIEFANAHRVPLFIGNPRNGRAQTFIKFLKPDVLFSVNYLFIIEKDLIRLPEQYAINIHGSLLPKYRGRTPHVWAIINNEKETGITAHAIEEGCDTGDIILQQKVAINNDDTGADILKKFENLYPSIIQAILEKVKQKQVKLIPQDNTAATFYGKRTPDDGMIDWNWDKERIRNWIRAQARPYPGAFSFANGHKIIIHKIQFSNQDVNPSALNGVVLKSGKNPVIKVADGAIELLDFATTIELKEGTILKYEQCL